MIENPGGFLKGISADNIIDRQNARNRLIADSLLRWKLVEKAGLGYDIMWEKSILDAKDGPDVSETDEFEFRVNINREEINQDFLKYINATQELLEGLDIHEIIAVHRISKGENANLSSKQYTRLLNIGLIEKSGYAKGTEYFLSKSYYTHSNKRGAYTKQRGLSDEKYKELILEHINNFGKAKIRELEDALKIKRRRIHRLLGLLRDTGKIKFEGTKKHGVWTKCG